MAAPVITCPACEKKFKGKDDFQGKKIKCPLCQTPFVVTSAQIKAGAPDKKAADPKSGASQGHKRTTWNAEDEDKDPYKLGEFDLRARCPNCANLMESPEAVICLFCGYNTQTREWGKTVKTVGITGGQHFLHLLPGFAYLLVVLIFLYGLLFFSLDLPRFVVGTWAWWMDSEAIRMWFSAAVLITMWVMGTLAYRRLIANPRPEERVKSVEDEDRDK